MSRFAILCSGQGAQSPGLFDGFPFTGTGLALRQRILDSQSLPPDIAAWLSSSPADPRAIFQNHFSQPLISLYQAMVWAELLPLIPSPVMIAGYSLGELSAYGCAGTFSPEDVVRLASTRARLMDAAGPRGELIAVTGLSPQAASSPDGAHLAIVIGDHHCVIGCLAERADSLARDLKAAGADDAVILSVTVASHTALLDTAVTPFRAALRDTPRRDPLIPVLAGINAAKVLRSEQMEISLPEQIHHTIRWDLIQQRFIESGCRVLLEIGPGCQLAHMACSLGLEARAVSEFHSPQGIATWLQSALRRQA